MDYTQSLVISLFCANVRAGISSLRLKILDDSEERSEKIEFNLTNTENSKTLHLVWIEGAGVGFFENNEPKQNENVYLFLFGRKAISTAIERLS